MCLPGTLAVSMFCRIVCDTLHVTNVLLVANIYTESVCEKCIFIMYVHSGAPCYLQNWLSIVVTYTLFIALGCLYRYTVIFF